MEKLNTIRKLINNNFFVHLAETNNFNSTPLTSVINYLSVPYVNNLEEHFCKEYLFQTLSTEISNIKDEKLTHSLVTIQQNLKEIYFKKVQQTG